MTYSLVDGTDFSWLNLCISLVGNTIRAARGDGLGWKSGNAGCIPRAIWVAPKAAEVNVLGHQRSALAGLLLSMARRSAVISRASSSRYRSRTCPEWRANRRN
jgi:hypothetical protein